MSGHSIITESRILKAVKLLKHVTRGDLALFFYGKEKRIKTLETLLPKLEKSGHLFVTWHNGKKVYSPVRKNRAQTVSIEHELGWVEVIIRLWRCRVVESEIVPERSFRGFAIVPECGIRFSEARGTMLVIEFETEKDFSRQGGGVVKSKLTRYLKHLPAMESWAKRTITVLFVVDTNRTKVKKFVEKMKPFLNNAVVSGISGEMRYPFFFTDFSTFKNVPVGKALEAKIYFWHDGKEWALVNHD